MIILRYRWLSFYELFAYGYFVNEMYDNSKHDYYADLLKKYFLESYSRFSNNSEYLFLSDLSLLCLNGTLI